MFPWTSPLRAAALDVLHAVRSLLRRRRSSLTTVILLILGIGLPTAMYSIVNDIALRGLPVPSGDKIVRVTTASGYDAPMPMEDFLALREQQRVLSEVAAYRPSLNSVVTRPDIGSKGVPATYVTGNLFRMLGVEPILGRNFTPEDESPGAPSVAIVSHGFWQSHFGGDREAIGETLVINREPMTLIGVMPPGFRFPTNEKAWSVVHWQGRPWSDGPVFAIGALHAMDAEEAYRQLRRLVVSWDDARPLNEPRSLHVVPFVETYLSPEILRSLDLLLLAVLGVMLIASINVAALRFGDSLARDHELFVRRALGARGYQLLRLLVAEALVLIAVSAIAGIGLAWVLLELVSDTLVAGSPVARFFWVEPGIDLRSCWFAAALSVAAVLIGGLLPSLWSLRRHRGNVEARATAGPGVVRLSGLLVAGQVAICFALLASSGVLVASGLKLLSREPGFDPQNLMRTLVTSYQANLETEGARRAFWETVLERLEAEPDIAAVTLASGVPWGSGLGVRPVPVEIGGGNPDLSTSPRAQLLLVLPGFFDVMRLPLISGRSFIRTDVTAVEAEAVTEIPVVVSASFARRHFPHEPIGRSFRFLLSVRDTIPIPARVVGVVADRGVARTDQAHTEETLYLPFSVAQRGGGYLIVRGRRGSAGLIRTIDRVISTVDPLVATLDDRSYRQEHAEELWVERRLAELFSVFAITAVILAFGGLLGAVLLLTQRRRKELAIRSVLGAAPRQLRDLVVWEGSRSVLLGLMAGLGLTWFVQRFVATFLYDVEFLSPVVLTGTAVGLAVLLTPAILGPAERAARTPPAETLNVE